MNEIPNMNCKPDGEAKAQNEAVSSMTGSVPMWVQDEIKATWNAARDSGNQHDSFRIIERMVDRLGYGRRDNNRVTWCELENVKFAPRFSRTLNSLVRRKKWNLKKLLPT